MSQSLTKMLQRRKALAAKRAEIDAEMHRLDQKIFPRVESLAVAFEGGSTAKHETPVEALTRIASTPVIPPRRPKILVTEVEAVLKEANRPMRTGEILEALKGRGIIVAGKVPQNNLSAHLSHHSDIFISTTNGWSLRQTGFVSAENTNAHAQH